MEGHLIGHPKVATCLVLCTLGIEECYRDFFKARNIPRANGSSRLSMVALSLFSIRSRLAQAQAPFIFRTY